MSDQTHYIVIRRSTNWGGPGDRIEVMAASRTAAGARRQQKRLGGQVECAKGPYRRYGRNELLRHAR